MAEETKGKTLEDVGTRYQHLTDLRDLWADGIQTLSNIKPQWRSEADTILRKNLELALEMLDKQFEVLSRYNQGEEFHMGREIEQAVKDVKAGKLLEGGK